MMSRATDSSDWPCEPAMSPDLAEALVLRNLRPADADKLGQLLYDAYKGTVDDDGQTLNDARQEAEGTLTGKYGNAIFPASYVVLAEETMVSACVVTHYKEKPLVAFAATLPQYQGKGLARLAMKQSIRSLADEGHSEVRLVVTAANERAKNLYEQLGFVPMDSN